MKTEKDTPIDDLNQQTIELDEPLKRGEEKITHVTIRKPTAGALRGVSLVDLAQVDVSTLQRVLPRITTPALTQQDVANMDAADLLSCGTVVSGFLLKKAQRQEVFQSA